jgi:hypothetical protein|tara:strand:- start:245 stop:421 length:177 start_codon:yes stop_codon:yes gene_type:complete
MVPRTDRTGSVVASDAIARAATTGERRGLGGAIAGAKAAAAATAVIVAPPRVTTGRGT